MKQTTVRIILAAALPAVFAGVLACSNRSNSSSNPQAGAAQAELKPDAVVATVGDKKITLAQVDEAIRTDLAELDEQRYQMRRQKRRSRSSLRTTRVAYRLAPSTKSFATASWPT